MLTWTKWLVRSSIFKRFFLTQNTHCIQISQSLKLRVQLTLYCTQHNGSQYADKLSHRDPCKKVWTFFHKVFMIIRTQYKEQIRNSGAVTDHPLDLFVLLSIIQSCVFFHRCVVSVVIINVDVSSLNITKLALTIREIAKSSCTFSATNISSNILWLLQLYDTIQMKLNYTWINYNHDNIDVRSHIMIYDDV